MHERLTTDRQALREREASLLRAEQAREALQEQLRKRSEELAERQKTAAEHSRLRLEEITALEILDVDRVGNGIDHPLQQGVALQQAGEFPFAPAWG